MLGVVGWVWRSVHDKKTIKGSVITNHLTYNAIKDYEPLNFDFSNEDILVVEKEKEPDRWTTYFEGVVNVYGNRAGEVMISPNKKQYPVLIKLQFEYTVNGLHTV